MEHGGRYSPSCGPFAGRIVSRSRFEAVFSAAPVTADGYMHGHAWLAMQYRRVLVCGTVLLSSLAAGMHQYG